MLIQYIILILPDRVYREGKGNMGEKGMLIWLEGGGKITSVYYYMHRKMKHYKCGGREKCVSHLLGTGEYIILGFGKRAIFCFNVILFC